MVSDNSDLSDNSILTLLDDRRKIYLMGGYFRHLHTSH